MPYLVMCVFTFPSLCLVKLCFSERKWLFAIGPPTVMWLECNAVLSPQQHCCGSIADASLSAT